jgi:hypothetical protein
VRQSLRLKSHVLIPVQPKPFKIGKHLVGELRPAPRAVDILDPDQELAAACAGKIVRQYGRKGVAEVEQAVGAGGKACPYSHTGASPVDFV